MIAGAWAVALTVLFGGTGLYCLLRLVVGRRRGIETVVDVNHVVMSPAMLAMVWWPATGVALWALVALFAAGALVFLRHLASSVDVTARAGALMHAAMNFGMVWMLLAMSSLTQTWTAMLSWDVVGSLALAAGWWGLRAVRSRGHRIACSCHGLATAGTATMLALMLPGLTSVG
ncbi:DUF5134 domain-containing protein [Kribbella sp. NPDC026611]|uniref:DUF5134 domain-containing protein n=1 Tax=Kribbella sp. NPDC026611 TaxID=3154911 RepID=UPI0033EBA5FF